MTEKRKPILCIDFDGVIHRYSKGWQDGSIYDPMTNGFINWAHSARELFKLVIYSSRSKTAEGIDAMRDWLTGCLCPSEQPFTDPVTIDDFEFASEKPPAFLTIDDRAVCFEGVWNDLNLIPEKLIQFKPWNTSNG